MDALYRKIINWLERSIHQRALRDRGCDTKCPRCKTWHSVTNTFSIPLDVYGHYQMICAKCGHSATFDFCLAPIPIIIAGDLK